MATGAFSSAFIDSTGTRLVLFFDPPPGDSWTLGVVTEDSGFGVPPYVDVQQAGWALGASLYSAVSITPGGRLKVTASLTGTARNGKPATIEAGAAWLTMGSHSTGAISARALTNRSIVEQSPISLAASMRM